MHKFNLFFPKQILCGVALALLTSVPIAAHAQTYTGPAVTFEQVYAHPDDQDLNLNYARQQASLGDYLSAASSLERMLYSQPNWDSARLFYALVLYRLDDHQASLRELDILKGRPLSSDQKKLHSEYMNKLSAATTGARK